MSATQQASDELIRRLLDDSDAMEDLRLDREDGKTYIHWNSFRLAQTKDGDIVMTFFWNDMEIMTIKHSGSPQISFPGGDKVTLYGMTGRVEVTKVTLYGMTGGVEVTTGVV